MPRLFQLFYRKQKFPFSQFHFATCSSSRATRAWDRKVLDTIYNLVLSPSLSSKKKKKKGDFFIIIPVKLLLECKEQSELGPLWGRIIQTWQIHIRTNLIPPELALTAHYFLFFFPLRCFSTPCFYFCLHRNSHHLHFKVYTRVPVSFWTLEVWRHLQDSSIFLMLKIPNGWSPKWLEMQSASRTSWF